MLKLESDTTAWPKKKSDTTDVSVRYIYMLKHGQITDQKVDGNQKVPH